MAQKTVTSLLVLTLLSFASLHSPASAATQTKISISPSSLVIPPGGNITVAVTVTNVTNLYDWQVAIKYKASVINCSAAWIPDDNVFQGQTTILGEPTINAPTIDGLNYTLMGATLLSGSVNVSSGTLFNINFTAVGSGETTILIGTKNNLITNWVPPGFTPTDWYSFLLDPDLNEIPFIEDDGFASVFGSHIEPGANVTVFPADNLGLTFANVTVAGSVTANETLTVQAPPLTNLVGQYYDVRVTASYSGNITVRLTYDDSNTTKQQESNLTMVHYTPILGDIRPPFGVVDMRDIGYIAKHFGTDPTSPLWDPSCDITGPQYHVPDGKVDMRDLGLVAKNFGNTAQWENITTCVDNVNNIIYGETTHFSLIGIHS